jgi:general secretion pathway protein J
VTPVRDRRGFTLLELIIALSIVGAMLVVAFGGLRVALAAWTQGEDRAEAHQHLRSVGLVLSRALAATYPYRAPIDHAPDAVLLFRGTEHRVEFVTQAAPFPAALPVAFTAVVIEQGTAEGPALVVRQRVLPNRDPFAEAALVLRDTTVHEVAFQYLADDGAWHDRWDGTADKRLPLAVRVTLAARRGERADALPPLTVALRTPVP